VRDQEATMTTAILALRPFVPKAEPQLVAANEPASAPPIVARTDAGIASPDALARAVVAAKAAEIAERARQRSEWIRSFVLAVLPPVLGFALFIGAWALFAQTAGTLPSPAKTWASAVNVFSNPFYQKGPNDQGIGWNILSSLKRVGIGFGLAAAIGIPLGFIFGRFAFANAMASPIISLLRPVSPLAWLPIGLLAFKAANPAAIWVIFISSIWPMIINTAVGVQRVPQDYLNVARVLNLSEWKIVTRILFPAVLPYMLTGVRLSIGVAWLVIVAAEMLTGGVGIGFWVWDEWNNLNVEHIIIAIFVVGIVGLLLEHLLLLLARRFNYE
jgi:nitrate/nitrite transport system permease protein